MIDRLMSCRRLVAFGIHAVLVIVSSYAALWLRFDGFIPPETGRIWLLLLPTLLVVRLTLFLPLRLYQGLWRYTSLVDMVGIVVGVFGSTAAFFAIVSVGFAITGYPRSVYFIDAMVLISLMSGVRMLRRLYGQIHRGAGERRVLIYGAGDAGEMIVRDMRHNDWYKHEAVGFVDDDRRKVGQRIHGVPVLGTREQVGEIIACERPDEVLIAMPTADTAAIRAIVKALEPFKIPIKTLPNLRDLIDNTVKVAQIRDLSIEDLLPRAPVGMDPTPVRSLVEGRTVLVTGAGGSIGSELCRQVAALAPRRLILLDRYENTLFAVSNELTDRHRKLRADALIGDVADWNRVAAIMSTYRPDVVFHAAAHKHVPLMEASPCEAVKNNVAGTWVLAHAARTFGVDRFVMVSTDKAVNPTSVMGVTKRVCELIVQALANERSDSRTHFAVVRFGNVLGSNGSVVPRFLEQIRAGGPVTVTHPEIKRYFMLIPEAVQLVLRAASLVEGGEVFVLDMGEQIRIADLARNLIRLSGFVPDDDIAIEYTGLRPGEKLFEELVGETEAADPVPNERMLRIHRHEPPEMAVIAKSIERLHRAAVVGDVAAVVGHLSALVPTYQPGVCRPNAASASHPAPLTAPVVGPFVGAWPTPASIEAN